MFLRSVGWCSASIWSAPDGSGLLTLDASSIQTDRDGSCWIVWMIKQVSRLDEPSWLKDCEKDPGSGSFSVSLSMTARG
jgi:hypothetical protein